MLLLVTSLALLAPTYCREPLNTLRARTMPTISNSLVNLGKMEIAFYYNGKPQDIHHKPEMFPVTSSVIPKPVFEEPCPCSNLRSAKSFNPFPPNPSEFINKLLNNDLFSFNKEPISSTFCCDSREHVHEETVFFDLSPPTKAIKAAPLASPLAFPPFILDHVVPSVGNPFKSKALEIYLFPKKKDLKSIDYLKMVPKKKELTKEDIQIVGEKKPKNYIKKFILPAAPTASPDKVSGKEEEIVPVTATTTANTEDVTNTL